MSRTITAAMATALAADALRVGHLVRLMLDSGPSYITDAYKAIEYDGNTYTALGHLLSFDAVEETARLLVADTRITLSTVDQTYLALFLGEQYINRRCTIWLALLGTDDALVADPVKMIEGRLDAPQSNEDPDSGTATLSVRVTNQWSDFERRNGRVTNSASQRALFSDDRGFEHTHKTLKPIIWGRP